jgi:hypothetical protein
MEPSVEDVRAAGSEFNLGREAFKAEEYAQAAEHFEKADSLVENPKVLLLAIESRQQAGQLARAATLAALAQERYPEDTSFASTRGLLTRALSELGKLKVTCDVACSLVVDSRIVPGKPALKRFVFLEPGSYKVRASFGSKDSEAQSFVSVQGESGKLEFSAPSADSTAGAEEWQTGADDGLPAAKITYDDPSRDRQPAAGGGQPEGLSPTFFWVGTGLSLALVGVSTWSGVDTLNNPGKEAVREQCGEERESCSLYQQGKDKELRTNLLWGATAAVGLGTILIGALWTDWGGAADTSSEQTGQRTARRTPSIEPWLVLGNGAALGARGRF